MITKVQKVAYFVVLSSIQISTLGPVIAEPLEQKIDPQYKAQKMQSIEMHNEEKKQYTEAQKKKWNEWQNDLKRKAGFNPTLHGYISRILDHFDNFGKAEGIKYARTKNVITNNDNLLVCLESSLLSKDDDALNKIKNMGVTVERRSGELGLTAYVPIDKLRSISDNFTDIVFIRPVLEPEVPDKRYRRYMQNKSNFETDKYFYPVEGRTVDCIKGSLVVTFNEGVDDSKSKAILDSYRCWITYKSQYTPSYDVMVPEELNAEEVLQELAHDPAVKSVTPNFTWKYGINTGGASVLQIDPRQYFKSK